MKLSFYTYWVSPFYNCCAQVFVFQFKGNLDQAKDCQNIILLQFKLTHKFIFSHLHKAELNSFRLRHFFIDLFNIILYLSAFQSLEKSPGQGKPWGIDAMLHWIQVKNSLSNIGTHSYESYLSHSVKPCYCNNYALPEQQVYLPSVTIGFG